MNDEPMCPISEAKRALQALYLEVSPLVANDVKEKVYLAFSYLAYNHHIDIEDGARAVKSVFEMSLIPPDTGFSPTDIAKAVADAWKLKY
jgi:hypothetical protein